MKKKITRIVSVSAVLVLLSSFFILPASATDTEVPSANFTLSSYPMRTLSNENGLILQFATSNSDGSIQNYYELVLDGNINNSGIQIGFYKKDESSPVLLFMFYNKILTNRYINSPTLYKYSLDGKLVNQYSVYYNATWANGYFTPTSSSSFFAPLTSEPVPDSLPCMVQRGTFMNAYADSAIPASITSIRVLNGSTFTGTCLSYSYRTSSGTYSVSNFSNDSNPASNSPSFSQWWSDFNVTINGITPVNPDLPNGGLSDSEVNYNNYELNKLNNNLLQKIYNTLNDIFTFLPELKGSGGADLTETNNAINEIGSKLDNIQSATPSDSFNSSQIDDYNQADKDVNNKLDKLKENTSGDGLTFDMNGEAIPWIYQQLEDVVKGNSKVFAVFLSILSMSLIMFVLNKGANA